MLRRLPVALLLVAACGGVASAGTTVPVATTAAPATTTTIAPTTTMAPTTTIRVTTTTTDLCAEATAESIAAFDIVFDRIDANPEGFLEADLAFMGDLGGVIASSCGATRSDEAISDLLVYFADEAATRPPYSVIFINSFLDAWCGDPFFELDPKLRRPARVQVEAVRPMGPVQRVELSFDALALTAVKRSIPRPVGSV